jgi:alkylhydroperoxidase family enzyme
MQSHAAVAALGVGDDLLVAAVLADWRTAPLNEQLRATLGFLEKVTLSPADLGPEDVAPLRAAGLSDQAIREALYVGFILNVMDRLADAFDFYLPSAQAIRRNGRIAHIIGYGMVSVPG